MLLLFLPVRGLRERRVLRRPGDSTSIALTKETRKIKKHKNKENEQIKLKRNDRTKNEKYKIYMVWTNEIIKTLLSEITSGIVQHAASKSEAKGVGSGWSRARKSRVDFALGVGFGQLSYPIPILFHPIPSHYIVSYPILSSHLISSHLNRFSFNTRPKRTGVRDRRAHKSGDGLTLDMLRAFVICPY